MTLLCLTPDLIFNHLSFLYSVLEVHSQGVYKLTISLINIPIISYFSSRQFNNFFSGIELNTFCESIKVIYEKILNSQVFCTTILNVNIRSTVLLVCLYPYYSSRNLDSIITLNDHLEEDGR